jgi:hypothetical protein
LNLALNIEIFTEFRQYSELQLICSNLLHLDPDISRFYYST